MKTGRVRQKAQPPAEEQPAPTQPPVLGSAPPGAVSRPAATAGKMPARGGLIVGGLFGTLACAVLIIILVTVLGGGGAKEWVKVTKASGEWTATVNLFGPQVTVEERWEADCTGAPNATVRTGTCVMKDTNTYNDKVVDEYDEFAYNIYYEETYGQIYEASGAEFVPTELKSDDWWQENRHYIRQEELDKESCQYTNYTVWVDDPQNKAQEIEVYLSECEVWDQVTVYERVYDQKAWCQCDVTTLIQIGQQSDSGTGVDVRWPNPSVPSGGRTERAFRGQVTFQGDDYTFTTTTEDLDQYQSYLTEQYYIGLRDGKPVVISKNPPQK